MTVDELDKIVELSLRDTHGQQVYGSHLSGGGFGGCIVTLLHRDAVEQVKTTISVSQLFPLVSFSVMSELKGCLFLIEISTYCM